MLVDDDPRAFSTLQVKAEEVEKKMGTRGALNALDVSCCSARMMSEHLLTSLCGSFQRASGNEEAGVQCGSARVDLRGVVQDSHDNVWGAHFALMAPDALHDCREKPIERFFVGQCPLSPWVGGLAGARTSQKSIKLIIENTKILFREIYQECYRFALLEK